MRQTLIGCACLAAAIVGAAFLFGRPADASPVRQVAELVRAGINSMGSQTVAPAPPIAADPLNCTMPQGGVGCCVIFSHPTPVQVAVTCRSATDCDYHRATSYGDGGVPTLYPADGGGGYVAIGSGNLISAGSTRYMQVPANIDTICLGTPDGGLGQVAGLY